MRKKRNPHAGALRHFPRKIREDKRRKPPKHKPKYKEGKDDG